MKRLLITLLLVQGFLAAVQAQKYYTRNGNVSFYSDAPLEDIEAHNNSAVSIWDTENGKIEFAVLIKAFQFEKALMQEHFNENYLESDQYPKGIFRGEMVDWNPAVLLKEGKHEVQVEGELTIHGVTRELATTGFITVQNGQLGTRAEFTIEVADYEIEIPAVVREKIAKEVKIVTDFSYEPLDSN